MKHARFLVFTFFVIIITVVIFSVKIQTDPLSEVFLDKSAKYVGVQHPHRLGFDGTGIKVAVIDTGVDYNHTDISGFGPHGKVVGGYDFVENDNFPQDTNGHGTEVAGIIAANGNLKGVSPGARILAYRVSDTGNGVSSDLIVKAIEKAVSDGAKIINLSLGVNRTNDKIDDAINYAFGKGVVVVAAAGNSGPELKTIGSPGQDPHTITVGATYNNITASLVATLEIDGKRFQVIPMVGIKPLSSPVSGQIVFGKYGKESDLQGMDVKDKILLVQRGSDTKNELLYFSIKEKNAANYGAKAIIVYNSEPGIFLGDLNNKIEGPDYKPRIPIVSMSLEDGLELRAILANKTVGTINAFYHPDFVSFFSSRGPVSPFYIKPDLVAPGVFVNTTSIHNRYNLTSGTSFAAPHVSGAVAILLQKNPNLKPEQIRSIISTSSDPVSDMYDNPFPQEISGAGRLNVTKAFDANLIINPYFAILDLSPFSKSQTVKIDLDTIDHTMPNPKIHIKFDEKIAKFEHWINGSSLYIKANMIQNKTGQYEGAIILEDRVIQHIPILLRIAEGDVITTDKNGQLDFTVNSQKEWSYAKISVFNDDDRLVNSASITPTKSTSIIVQNPGKYGIQAEVKAGKETVIFYNTIIVRTANQNNIPDIGLPERQLIILVGIGFVIVLAGLIMSRKRS